MATKKLTSKQRGVVVTEDNVRCALLENLSKLGTNRSYSDEFTPTNLYSWMDECMTSMLGENVFPPDASDVLTMICKVMTQEIFQPDYMWSLPEEESYFFTILLKASYAIACDYHIPTVPFINSILQMEGESWGVIFDSPYYTAKPVFYLPLKALVSLTDDTDSLLLDACEIKREEVVKDVEEVMKDTAAFHHFIHYCMEEDFSALKEFMIREKNYLSDDFIADQLFEVFEKSLVDMRYMSPRILLEMLENFPEMVKEILTYVLLSNICFNDNNCKSNNQKIDLDVREESLFDVLNCIKDYQKYASLPFKMGECPAVIVDLENKWIWEDLLYTVFYSFDGTALKAIADMLVNDFGICQDDVISFLVGLTMDELNVVEEELREKDESPEYGYIVKQLSHPLVYEIVTIQMPALIELGKGLQGKYEWHKEETEVRIY